MRVLQVVEFLNSRAQEKKSVNALLYQAIERRASQAVDAECLEAVISLQIKKEMLEVENMIIQSKLLRFTQILDNKDVL